MPRSRFLEAALGLVSSRCCVSTFDVMAELGLNHSTAYYVLRRLYESGAVEKYVLGGRVAYWCVPGRDPATCHVKLQALLVRGLCAALNGARGGVAVVSAAELLRAAGYETNAPSVLAAAVQLFEAFGVSVGKKRKKGYVYFIVDVAKARDFCEGIKYINTALCGGNEDSHRGGRPRGGGCVGVLHISRGGEGGF